MGSRVEASSFNSKASPMFFSRACYVCYELFVTTVGWTSKGVVNRINLAPGTVSGRKQFKGFFWITFCLLLNACMPCNCKFECNKLDFSLKKASQ